MIRWSVAALLMTVVPPGMALAREMTPQEAEAFLDKDEYLACKADEQCILAADPCRRIVAVAKHSKYAFEHAARVQGRAISCPTPSISEMDGRFYRPVCEHGACKAQVRPDVESILP